MLKIKNVSARNFMSVGAQTQAVNFDTNSLTLVLGNNLDLGGDGSRNGTGKTTIINALSFGLYGEALTNIRKDNLVNLTNGKGMLVTVDFEKDGVEYRIERGRKPAVLRLLVNGVDVDDEKTETDDAQGDSRETQKEIEKIIGFPHEVFKHIIALNTYTEPFLNMKAAEQRAMIELLLGITDLSAKAEVLKSLMKDTKDSIKEEEVRISAVRLSNERIEKNIADIERRSDAWERSKADKLTDMIATIETLQEINVDTEIENHRYNAGVKEQNDARTTLEAELSRSKTAQTRSSKKIAELEANIKAAKEGVCPSCGQDTAHLDTHETYTADLVSKLAEEQRYYAEVNGHVTEITEALDALGPKQESRTVFYDSIELALEHKHNLETLALQYAEKSADENPYTAQIENLRLTGLQEINFELINELTYLKEHQEFLYKLLTSKDSFIRKRIIDQNIAYLNHRLAYYLEKTGLPHDVKFNSDLTVEITEYGRELDFDNLSRGERNRLILSISWAFRDIYESLNHPMNLMFVDEMIDSGMDTMGVENALAVLKKMNRDHNKSIFLVSHKEELIGRVNNVLTVVKTGGFTEYTTDAEYAE